MQWVTELGKRLLQEQLLPGNFFWKMPFEHAAALTFDDGPHPTYTPALLDVLARHGVRATFFVIGNNVLKYPSITRDIVAAGHALGSHTQTHRELPSLSREELKKELDDGRKTIRDVTAVDTRIVRPPRGRTSVRMLYRARALGYQIVHWSKTYSDYRQDGTERLLTRMKGRPPEARDILLLHDTNEFTVQALATILPQWLAGGVTFAGFAPNVSPA